MPHWAYAWLALLTCNLDHLCMVDSRLVPRHTERHCHQAVGSRQCSRASRYCYLEPACEGHVELEALLPCLEVWGSTGLGVYLTNGHVDNVHIMCVDGIDRTFVPTGF